MYQFSILINGEWRETDQVLEVNSPYDGRAIGKTYRCGPAEIETAIVSAKNAFEITKKMPVYQRAEILAKTAAAIRENLEDFAQILSAEAGKPIKQARVEVERAVFTFTDAAEEAKRIRGEEMSLEHEAAAAGRWALIKRFPIGVILGITPFNFPLNLVAHKVAPAIASGNSIILKPASQTPFSTLRMAREILKAGWPAEALQVLPMDSRNAHLLVKDERIAMISFTGSPVVGWALKNQSGRKKIALELGGNAGVIVHHDADLEYAATRCVAGGFSYAGQSCISVQRVYVHKTVYDKFKTLFLDKVKALKYGDPSNPGTDVGPMIAPYELERVEQWIGEAVKSGAKIECGGKKEGTVFQPTVLSNVGPEQKISCQEVFAPVIVLYEYDNFEDAVQAVNDSEFGLQAGVFTNDAKAIFKAYEELEVGGVIIGDVSTYRIDHMPYGGTKASGMGREGARFAIEEMTEPKLLVMNL